ncbi:cation transport protein-domain-containing protein [Bombardia bombarda]|uniref:Potassium transport protein n=1 Tax=Bombardia bombarda TaxID=252184 RepID=A0AA39WAK2_9PEZI|nr:cation transport protein-domain-containing protein [Bombardia bombarda]
MSRRHGFGDHNGRASGLLLRFCSYMPPLNFISIHYGYFIIICLASSLIFWGSSNPASSISYTDSLFLVVSAMTEAGLNTVNLSQMTTWQQILLFLLIIFGSSIWVSIWTVLARMNAFEKRFHDVVNRERMRRTNRTGSTISLPNLQRFLPFRRSQTATTLSPGAQDTRSSSPDTEGIRSAIRRSVSRSEGDIIESVITASAGADAHGTRVAAAQNTTAGNLEAPGVSSGTAHIAFADKPHPNTEAHATATSTATQCRRSENRLFRRNGSTRGGTVENVKSEFSVRHFLTYHTAGRNSQFHDLSVEEREQLGGCEYRALRVLAVIVPLYFFLWQFIGCIALGAWINNHQAYTPLGNGINPWWLGVFNGASAFNNSGMSLLDANMIPFQNSPFVLVTMGIMILAGNTAYPIFLRLIIWFLLKVLTAATPDTDFSSLKDTFKFILTYPRRVYTNIFPSRATWWLLFMLILLNSVDWVAFELLNLGNPAIESIPRGSRVLDGLFQALAVRSGGFYVVAIPALYIGLQVLYVIMMYISVYPVVITMRHSNVYEERSLGIYADNNNALATDFERDPGRQMPSATTAHGGAGSSTTQGTHNTFARRLSHSDAAATLGRALQNTFTWHGVGVRPPSSSHNQTPESRINFISQQIHGQLAHDIWWLVLAVLVIMTIETSNFLADPVTFSVFNVIFEVVSAYGCVGISVGLPNAAYSFSGAWHTASKLVLCVVMLRGRHRGLPVALDRAVRLPGEQLHQEEEEDHRIRRSISRRPVSGEA